MHVDTYIFACFVEMELKFSYWEALDRNLVQIAFFVLFKDKGSPEVGQDV
jgi:hypothetical protein